MPTILIASAFAWLSSSLNLGGCISMSTTGSQMHENALLNQQVEMLARDSAALSTATSRGRAIRLVLFVLLVAMLGFFCYSFYHMGDRMINGADYHKQLLDAAQKHFETN